MMTDGRHWIANRWGKGVGQKENRVWASSELAEVRGAGACGVEEESSLNLDNEGGGQGGEWRPDQSKAVRGKRGLRGSCSGRGGRSSSSVAEVER